MGSGHHISIVHSFRPGSEASVAEVDRNIKNIAETRQMYYGADSIAAQQRADVSS